MKGNGSSPKQLSKVHPMVAGHAISRPRIQLARMDLSSMTAVQDQVRNEDNDNLIEEEEMFINSQEDNHEVEDIEEEIPATPPHQQPTRNLFDLTNIREESTLMDECLGFHGGNHHISQSQYGERRECR